MTGIAIRSSQARKTRSFEEFLEERVILLSAVVFCLSCVNRSHPKFQDLR